MSAATKYMAWMTGSAWVSAASAGLLPVFQSASLRWLCIFGAVFNGIFAIYWGMMAVSAAKPKERG